MIDTAQLAIAITVYVFIGSLLMFIPSLLAWLAPNSLFGTGFLEPLTHAVVWSLTLNVLILW